MSTEQKKDIKKAAPVALVTQTNSPEPVIYAGSNYPTIGLVQHTVYLNGLPKNLQSHIEKCPAIGRLMVPIGSLAEAKCNLAEIGSREHTLNEQVKTYVRGDQS